MNRFFKNLFETKTKTSRKDGFRPSLETLEDRRLMSISMLPGGYLKVVGTGNPDTISIGYAGGSSPSNPRVAVTIRDVNGNLLESGLTYQLAVNRIIVEAGDGNDLVVNDTTLPSEMKGGAGNDTLRGGSVSDDLWGEGDSDRLEGRGGNDNLVGGRGNDFFGFGDAAGRDQVFEYAGEGSDWLDFTSRVASPVSIDLNTYWQDLGDSTVSMAGSSDGFENVRGTNLGDTLIGNGLVNRLEGQDGADHLQGQGGNDSLVGGAGNDTYAFAGLAVGDDTITELTGGGTDWLNYSGFGAGISVFLGQDSQTVNHTHDVQLDLTNPEELENVIGTAYGDWLFGNDRANQLEGRGSADTLEGRGGNDSLIGGTGGDTYVWSAGGIYGHDTITEAANTGTDTLDFSNAGLGVGSHFHGFFLDLAKTSRQTAIWDHLELTFSSSTGIENFVGSNQDDYVYGNSRNNLMDGRDGNDELWGRGGNDELHGGVGNDWLFGEEGADDLYGEEHDDWLVGGDDGDWIYGGSGRDTLEGGDATDYLFGEGDDDELYGMYDGAGDDDDDDHIDSGDGWDYWEDGYLCGWI